MNGTQLHILHPRPLLHVLLHDGMAVLAQPAIPSVEIRNGLDAAYSGSKHQGCVFSHYCPLKMGRG